MQKLVKKSTDTTDTPWGLDWFVQAGHGGSGNRNCTLVEDASLGTPAYPYVTGQGPTTTWVNSGVTPKGDVSGSGVNQNMWRWQSMQEFQYPLIEYLNVLKDKPLFLGIESVVAGHEHTSATVITGQIPKSLKHVSLPTTPGYTALGNATALSKWEYCFDRGDSDTSRGAANNWNCAVPGSANEADVSWSVTGQKLVPSGTDVGLKGHAKTVEAVKWMQEYAKQESYYLPTHLERAGPFNPQGNNGFNIEHLRNFNNAAPDVAFGFETQPGHGASSDRGEYAVNRNTIGGVRVDSVGGTTYGGTGVYGAVVGGVWDALLGEGRQYWFFASSDWHNRGSFGPDDRRSTQDFYPGEYQRSYTFVEAKYHDNDRGRGHDRDRGRDKDDKLTPQQIVDGMRTGNIFTTSGQLIDRLGFVACESKKRGRSGYSTSEVEELALDAVLDNTAPDAPGCATMGETLEVDQGSDVVVAIVVRDPAGTNYSPYTFPNPSLLQVGINQPLNAPVLDHVDLIRGMVTGLRTPGSPEYSGEWPRNTDWLRADGTTAGLAAVPAGAKNTSAAVIRTFGNGTGGWRTVTARDGTRYLKTSYRLSAVEASQYLRLRGTNLPAAVPFETDANGNPLADVYTNASNRERLAIPCTTVHSAASQFDGCPDHLGVGTGASRVVGQKAVSYDVAAWADLWFYSNPIYVEVEGRKPVACRDRRRHW
jgi:hypothetical protein